MTDLHTPSDTATAPGADAMAPGADAMASEGAARRTFRAATLDEAVAAARSELGPEVELIEAHRVRRGGLGGFFATDLGVEIIAAPGRRPASRPATAASSTPTPPPPTRAEREEPRVATGLDRLIERVESAEASGGAGTGAAASTAAGAAASGTERSDGGAGARDALASAIAEAIGGSHPFDEQMRNEQMRNEQMRDDRLRDGMVAPAASAASRQDVRDPAVDRVDAPIPPLVDPLSALDDELAQATTPSPRSTIDELDADLARHSARRGIDGLSLRLDLPTGSSVDEPAPSPAPSVDDFEALDTAEMDRVATPAELIDTVPDEDVVVESDDTAFGTTSADGIDLESDDESDAEVLAEVIGPDEGEWAPGEAALRQRKKELDRTLGALEEIDDLLRDVGVNVPARTDVAGTALVRAEPAPVEEIARVATSQLVEGIAALDGRCSSEIRRVSVSVTGVDGTTVCMSTELGDRRG